MQRQIETLAKIVGGRVRRVAQTLSVKGISTDTRSLKPGDLYIALRGPNFDGHDFVSDAVARGAAGIIISRPIPEEQLPEAWVIQVNDTLAALGDLGRYHRNQCQATVVAVTGSNGKTTVKEMIHHVLSKDRQGIKSVKSFNNAVGVPLTLLRLLPTHEFAVVEMGTNGPGEIRYLAGVARPDVGVITNVSETHLKGLGSVDGVAAEKSQLIHSLEPSGVAVLNQDNEHTREMARRSLCRVVTFGVYQEADIQGADITTSEGGLNFTINREVAVEMNGILGPWNVYNALAASAVCVSLGLELGQIAARLADYTPPPMRMERSSVNGITFINDAYNAAPRSTRLAVGEFAFMPCAGRKILVLGDMLELGEQARLYHERLADQIMDLNFHAIYAVGELSRHLCQRITQLRRGVRVRHFDDSEQAGMALLREAREGDMVLLKGSREIRLERILEAFRPHPAVALS